MPYIQGNPDIPDPDIPDPPDPGPVPEPLSGPLNIKYVSMPIQRSYRNKLYRM